MRACYSGSVSCYALCVHVRRLQLTNFRNYREVDLPLEAGRLLFAGDNAQGKSNLLEAVQMLSSSKSVRASTDVEMIGWQESDTGEQPFARLQADVERRGPDVQLEALVVGQATRLNQASTRAGKRFRVNGIGRRAIDFVGQLRSVLFTADDLEIISGSPSVRRAYLDTALSQLDRAYYGALQRYGRILQQRNASLKRIREGLGRPDELMLWDDSYANEGSLLIMARRDRVHRLAELATDAQQRLSGNANESLRIAYEPQLGDEWRGLLPEESELAEVRRLFAAALEAGRRRDIAAGVSLVGPHRDDFSIQLNGVSAASFGSRAQIRTSALSLRLAEAHLLAGDNGDPPVLLLDDIVSELDEGRRAAVLSSVEGFEQVWFTSTNTAWLPPEFVAGCRVFEVRSGSVVGR